MGVYLEISTYNNEGLLPKGLPSLVFKHLALMASDVLNKNRPVEKRYTVAVTALWYNNIPNCLSLMGDEDNNVRAIEHHCHINMA